MNQLISTAEVRPFGTVQRALTLTAVTAALFGLVTFPLSASAASTGLSVLLVSPLAGVVTAILLVTAQLRFWSVIDGPGGARWACMAASGVVVFALGAYVSNAALVDDPLQLGTLVGYAISLVAALSAVASTHLLVTRTAWGAKLQLVSKSALGAALAAPAAVGLVVLDVSFLNEGYPSFHWAVLVTVVFLLGGLAQLGWPFVGVRIWGGGVLALFGVWALVAFSLEGPELYAEVAARATADRRLLLLARSWADRDGDGFSATFGGGDCDDRDARVHPLSSAGRDCLGWMGKEAPHVASAPPSAPAPVGPGPRVLLLITVDALRCDTRAPVFRGESTLCPNLERLAADGRSRDDARTTYPRTTPAIASLHGALPYAPTGQKQARLATWLAAQGRKTHAVSTHAMQLPDYVARSFDSVDKSLQPKTSSGSTTTSPEVSARTLEWLRANRDVPVFVWSHYFDPHSPYVDPPGSRSALAPATRRYAAEVRRTDAEIGRLIRDVAALESSLLVLVTADHGEEFAEHGNQYHGTTLYEAAVRIPMVVWTPQPSLLPLGTDIPASLAEVAPFLSSAGRGEPFRAANEQFFWVASQGKRLVGIFVDGYKLSYDEGLNLGALYDVARDPAESRNLFDSSPEVRQRLGARLATYLTPGAPPTSERD